MIAIISDVHGNYIALQKVLKEIDSLGISEVYCLGDVAGYYSQINECCDELRRRNVKCVMGNHDWYMVSGTECDRSNSVRICIDYQRTIITQVNMRWLLSFRSIITANDISMVHGGWKNPIDEYIKPTKEYFESIKGRLYMSGHTHVQGIYKYGETIYCNPGSVGQPRDGDNRAAFATFNGTDFELHRVEYDIDEVGYLMEKAGFNKYYYSCLKDASEHLHD